MSYVDGFLIPVPKKNVKAYTKMAKLGAKIWHEHGALAYFECVGDELSIKGVPSFAKQIGLKSGETVFFSWIVYKSKAHRNQVNAKVMKDPRMKMPDTGKMPFDVKRMCYGGFKVIVKA